VDLQRDGPPRVRHRRAGASWRRPDRQTAFWPRSRARSAAAVLPFFFRDAAGELSLPHVGCHVISKDSSRYFLTFGPIHQI
jgi:hypothetical protein